MTAPGVFMEGQKEEDLASQSELPGTIGQTVAEIESLGAEAIAVAADPSNEDNLEEAVHSAIDRFGGEYTDWVFFAERELAALGLSSDD
jgi:hypothetical protein